MFGSKLGKLNPLEGGQVVRAALRRNRASALPLGTATAARAPSTRACWQATCA